MHIGKKIVNKLESTPYKEIGSTNHNGSTMKYKAVSELYTLELKLDLDKALELLFTINSQDKHDSLHFSIDTDLYDISQTKYQNFGEEIEKDILSFLESLEKGSILVGTKGRRMAMIIPRDGGYILVKKGRFLTSSRLYKSLDALSKEGDFHKVTLG